MPRRRARRPGRLISLIGVLVLAVLVIYVWRRIPASAPMTQTPSTVSAPQEDLKRQMEQISEKIRAAHLNKDINKWLSVYSSSYPNLGRLENRMLEIWKNNDIKEVSYRISNVQPLGNNQATADIIWNIQVYDHHSHDYTLVRQSYRITLVKGSDGWKIRDSKELGGGPS